MIRMCIYMCDRALTHSMLMEDKRSPHTAQMTIRALAIICAHPHRVEAAHSSLTWWRGVLEAAANRGGAQGGLQRCCDVPERLEQAQVSRCAEEEGPAALWPLSVMMSTHSAARASEAPRAADR